MTPLADLGKADTAESILGRFGQQVRRHGTRLAVRSARRALTYEELDRAASRVARAVLDRLGPGAEPVALVFGQEAPLIAAMLGVLKAGKFYVPLDPLYPRERTIAMLDQSQSRLIVTNTSSITIASELARQAVDVVNVDDLQDDSLAEMLRPVPSPDDYAYILFTSGSTGQPKGVIENHRNVLSFTTTLTDDCKLGPDDRLALVVSCSFSGSVSTIFGSLLNGASLHMFDLATAGVGRLAEWLVRERITVFIAAAVYNQLAAALQPGLRFPDLRVLYCGGQPLYPRDVAIFRRHFPDDCVLVNALGATEKKLLTRYIIERSTELSGDLVPVGYPVPGTQISLLDEEDRPVGVGEVGEITVTSRNITPGFWQQPELTATTFRPAPHGGPERVWRTGDLGRLRPDGCLEHLGRKDAQVKIRGHRVELGEVEAALLALPELADAAVASRADDGRDNRLVAYVVPAPGQAPSVTRLRAALRARLPASMVPTAFVQLETLPRNPNGKIDRLGLPEPTHTRPVLDVPHVAPRSAAEVQLVGIWRDLLTMEGVGVEDDFFDLGADSLTVLGLLAEIERIFGVVLDVSELVPVITIERLGRLLETKPTPGSRTAIIPLQPGGERPPFVLLFGIGGGVLDFAPLSRLLGPGQPVYGLRLLDEAQIRGPRLEDMAAWCVEQLRAFRPEGPHLLGGHSFGGVLAYEVARQLEAGGDEVRFVALLDTPCPGQPVSWDQFDVWAMARVVGNAPGWALGFAKLGPRTVGGRIKRKARLQATRLRRLFRSGPDTDSPIELPDALDDVAGIPDDVREVMTAHVRAVRQYQPGPCGGRLSLFRARTRPLLEIRGPDLGWGALAGGGVEVHDIPGNHVELFRAPFLQALAEELRACLEATAD